MTEPEVYVQLIDFHMTKCRETVVLNEDGSYTIFINSRHASNIQREAYDHAMRHIRNGDFEKRGESIQRIEAVAHGLAVQAEIKRKRKRLSKYEKYMQKMNRHREVMESFGLQEHTVLVDDEYGCPKVLSFYQ